MTLARDAIPSPNYSSRGSGVRLIVLHTTEGSTTYQSLGAYFASSSAGVSSHAGIDDTPGIIGVYVRRGDKAWTQGNANPYSVAAELCAFAAWGPDEWAAHPAMLSNTAQWVAEEAAAFGIPLVALSAQQAQTGAAGVCQHADLGASGGGHWDCGPHFPMHEVIRMAAGGSPIPAQVLAYASGQEDAGVSLSTGPDGSRVDMLFVAIDGSIHHWWANSPGDLTDPNLRHGEILEGHVREGGGVSGGWTADKKFYVACCEGDDNRPYINWTDDRSWSGWVPAGVPNMLRPT